MRQSRPRPHQLALLRHLSIPRRPIPSLVRARCVPVLQPLPEGGRRALQLIRLAHLLTSAAEMPPVYRSYIQPDADAEFPAEAGRYHLYVAYSCPFASRALASRNLSNLEDIVGLSVVHPIFQKTRPDDPSDAHLGWAFVDPAKTPMVTSVDGSVYKTDGCTPDTVNQTQFTRDLYELVDKTPRAFSVPILWDSKTRTIVSSESADILRTLNTGFRSLAPTNFDLYPTEHEQEVETANNGIVAEITSAYFKSAFATDPEVASAEWKNAFVGIAKLEALLASSRYVVQGLGVTETDIRLFFTLIRVDVTDSEPSLAAFRNVVGVRAHPCCP
jgi:putative glutathione S-transferase